MKHLVCIALLLPACVAEARTDSLLRALPHMPGDSSKVEALAEASRLLLLERTDSAIVLAEQALALARKLEWPEQVAAAHNRLGLGYNLKGDRSKALPHFLLALDIMLELGEPERAGNVRSNLARLYLDEKQLDLAEAEYRLAMAEFRISGQPIWEAGMMQGLADVYRNKGLRDSALVLFGRAADMLSGLEQPVHAALAKHNQALYTDGPGEEALALERHREALRILGDAPGTFARISILTGLGKALVRKHQDDEAGKVLGEALLLATTSGQSQAQHDLHQVLAGINERQGRTAAALHHLRQYVALHDSIASADRARSILEIQERHESERKNLELAHSRVLLERRTRSLHLLAFGVALLVMALAFLWRALREKRRTALALQGTLRERELLLREIHHRVKNNLQMVGGLLRMQGRHIADPAARDAVRDSQDRVRSMALIHQDLYMEDDPRGIAMAPYIEKLAKGLLKSHGVDPGRITLATDVEPLHLDVDTAMPIGLILNELVVNALKHAFPNGRQGALHITLRRTGDELLLEVADDGIGHDAQQDRQHAASGFGLGMLRTFAEKLQARYEMNGSTGTTVRMHIRNFEVTH
jgi:two-component sensor histidine kinase